MPDDSVSTLPRLARLRREHIQPSLYRAKHPVDITAWVAPGEPVPFAEAREQTYAPFAMGSAWGRPWGTTWFHVTGSVPTDWSDQPGTGVELLVDLGFGSQPGFTAEGMAYAADGTVIKGIQPRNAYVPVAGPGPVDL